MRAYEDSYRHKGLRKKLVEGLRQKGICDEGVLEVMGRIPRHFFMDTALESFAYQDRAFPIAEEQTISQPYTVAYQTQLLELSSFDKVLEIGTGSAYQACILAEMGARVFTIERQKKLFDQLKQFAYLQQYPTIRLFFGDGFEGLPSFAPFDKILITAAAPFIPPALTLQLKEGGKMVIPIGGSEGQRMFRLTKKGDFQDLEQEIFDNFSFVPMLGGKRS